MVAALQAWWQKWNSTYHGRIYHRFGFDRCTHRSRSMSSTSMGGQRMSETEPCQRCGGTGVVYNKPEFPEDYNPILRWHAKQCPACRGREGLND